MLCQEKRRVGKEEGILRGYCQDSHMEMYIQEMRDDLAFYASYRDKWKYIISIKL
jgi:hypothetical protein